MSFRSASRAVIIPLSVALGAMVSCSLAGGSVFGPFDNSHYRAALWLTAAIIYAATAGARRREVPLVVATASVLVGAGLDRTLILLLDWKDYNVFGFVRTLVFLVAAVGALGVVVIGRRRTMGSV